ncbi:MAG: type II secretion system protein GspM [Gammaproteobacteria bacterium]
MFSRWYLGLDIRERRALWWGGAIIAILIAYLLVVDPLEQAVGRLRVEVASQRDLNEWLRKVALEAQALRKVETNHPLSASEESFLSVIDRTAEAQGLKQAIQRLTPEEGFVRVWLERAPFDEVVLWLTRLTKDFGITATAITVSREDVPGLVQISLTLARPGPTGAQTARPAPPWVDTPSAY